jgi:hypothetical protein
MMKGQVCFGSYDEEEDNGGSNDDAGGYDGDGDNGVVGVGNCDNVAMMMVIM